MLRQFLTAGFATLLNPSPFTGVHFKRWQTKIILWLTAMIVYWVMDGKPGGTLTGGTLSAKQERAFRDATVLFVGGVISVIGDKFVGRVFTHTRCQGTVGCARSEVRRN